MSSSVKVDLDFTSGLDPNTLTRASKTQNSGAGVVNTNKYAFPISKEKDVMRTLIWCAASAIALSATLSAGVASGQEMRGPEEIAPVSPQERGPANQAPNASLPAESDLGEIIVTARRVSERLQDVPVAVTAYTGSALQEQGARAMSDISLLTPSLRIETASVSGAAAVFSIRGQVQQDALATLDPSVGVYVDGVYWARAHGINGSLLDLRDVQTLKGPQGTLFGRNTTGGAILFTTNDPDPSAFSGLVSGTYGRFDYWALTGVLNAPLVRDKIAIRIAAQRNKRDGYIRETRTGADLDTIDDYTIRGKLLVEPTDTLKIVFSAERFRTDTRQNPYRLAYVSPTGLAALESIVEVDGLAASAGLGCFDPAGRGAACIARAQELTNSAISAAETDRFANSLSSRTYAKTGTYGVTATLDTDFGSIKAIGGYRKVNGFTSLDLDGSPFVFIDFSEAEQNLKQYSGELIVTGKAFADAVDFAAGAFYFHESGFDRTRASVISALNPTALVYDGRIENDSLGFYGQGTWHATEALSFTGGLRYSVDDKRLTTFNGNELSNGSFLCGTTICPFVLPTASFKGISYTAGVDYKINDDVLVYGKIARGFRSGGQNLRSTNFIPASLKPFKPEIATSYEAGIKSEWLDRHLRFNLAVHYTQGKDIQRSLNLVTPDGLISASVINNAGQADFYGGELEASALLPGGFRIDGTASYTHAKYVKYVDEITGFDRRQEPFYFFPKWTASISPSWSREFGFGRAALRADFAYQSEMRFYPLGFYTDAGGAIREASTGVPVSATDAAGFSRQVVSRSHWLINARAAVTILEGRLDLALWGKNLGNSRNLVSSLPTFGLGYVANARREPRTFGVTATVKFAN